MNHVILWQSPPKNEKMRTKIYGCQHFEMPKCNVSYLFWESPCCYLTFIFWHFEMLMKYVMQIYLFREAMRNVNEMQM